MHVLHGRSGIFKNSLKPCQLKYGYSYGRTDDLKELCSHGELVSANALSTMLHKSTMLSTMLHTLKMLFAEINIDQSLSNLTHRSVTVSKRERVSDQQSKREALKIRSMHASAH